MRSNNLGYVAQLRYIQATREPRERRNPDNFIRHFFPLRERLRYRFLSRAQLDEIRSQPFYFYLLARTRYYDMAFHDAISENVRYIVNIGCGSDTRAHRFRQELKRAGTTVVECDLPDAIVVKRQLANRLGPAPHIRYAALDLNDDSWPDLARILEQIGDAKAMVMMEGVSPYVESDSFSRFLTLLGNTLARGTVVAYDFKLLGVVDDFGRSGRAERTFRLPNSRREVADYHAQRGFQLTNMETSWELEARLLPQLADAGTAFFRQDGLVKLCAE